MIGPPPRSPLFPYTTLFRSARAGAGARRAAPAAGRLRHPPGDHHRHERRPHRVGAGALERRAPRRRLGAPQSVRGGGHRHEHARPQRGTRSRLEGRPQRLSRVRGRSGPAGADPVPLPARRRPAPGRRRRPAGGLERAHRARPSRHRDPDQPDGLHAGRPLPSQRLPVSVLLLRRPRGRAERGARRRNRPAARSRAMTPARIKLLAFTTLFAIGGTERHLMSLMEGLDHSRFELEFGCLQRVGEFLGQVEARGIPITEYPLRHVYGPRALVQQVRFARHLRRRGVDIVHTFGFYANLFGIAAARLAGTPLVIASIRDTGYHLTPRQQRVQRLACRVAHHVLVNAEAVKRWLVAGGYDGRRLSVIPNGLDASPFTAARRAAPPRREARPADGASAGTAVSRP